MVSSIPRDSQLWTELPWKKFQKHLSGLQSRVYKAAQRKDYKSVTSLQKLIASSKSANYLATRQVTQLNDGKKTPGIDGKSSLTFKERFEVCEFTRKNSYNWNHSGLRNISIPKPDGSRRILKIPTIKDRIWQCLSKFLIEPAHEASFHANNYGFRQGRSTHDAQKILFLNLNSYKKGYDKRIISLDIEKCFDRISHNSIMSKVIAPQRIKLGIFRCLKSGIQVEFPAQGTPQGGVISPLLANIVLNGIENIHTCVRYADDLVFILKPKDNADEILQRVEKFLEARKLAINKKKTIICSTKSGFDFLGWHFLCQENGKFKSYPSNDNFKKAKKKIKQKVNSASMSVINKVTNLSAIVRGWRNYHKFCSMNKSKLSLWATKLKAYKKFKTEKRTNEQAAKLVRQAFPEVPTSENTFINVKGNKSPFDGDNIYWAMRNSKEYDKLKGRIIKDQRHSCNECGLLFMGEQKVHLHHKDRNKSNNSIRNLSAVHQSCHNYIHMKAKVTLG